MIRQARITASAQSEDSGVGRMTTGSGYSELLALRELEGTSSEANGEPAVTVQETQIDATSEGDAVIGDMGSPQNSSELKLLREESTEDKAAKVDTPSQPAETGVLNPINEDEEVSSPDRAAPYLVSHHYPCPLGTVSSEVTNPNLIITESEVYHNMY